MTDVMTHRGPNDRGTYKAPGIALGARRLSIVDVAGGHQPFANEDRTVWAVQNGELYNHDALRDGLRRTGHPFRTRCDTEVLPHLYERYGERYREQLRGKFATRSGTSARRRAVVTRDRLGIKPLYYARRRRSPGLRIRAEEHRLERLVRGSSTTRASTPSSRSASSRPRDASCAASRSCSPATSSSSTSGAARRALLGLSAADAGCAAAPSRNMARSCSSGSTSRCGCG